MYSPQPGLLEGVKRNLGYTKVLRFQAGTQEDEVFQIPWPCAIENTSVDTKAITGWNPVEQLHLSLALVKKKPCLVISPSDEVWQTLKSQKEALNQLHPVTASDVISIVQSDSAQ